MADVVVPAGIGAQGALVAGLNWRMFRNTLRHWVSGAELVAVLLNGLFLTALILGTGTGLGLGALVLVRKGLFSLISLLLWVVLLAWQIVPVLILASTVQLDFRSLLRFPLRFSAFCTLSLVAGIFDPVAVAALFWLACIAGGIGYARPDMLPAVVLVLVVFAAVNLLLSRLIFAWLERWLARRRSREIFLLVFFLAFLVLEFLFVGGQKPAKPQQIQVPRLFAAASLLPPDLAARGLAAAGARTPSGVATAVALLAAYSAGFGLLWLPRLRAQYRGEHLGETAPAALPGTFAAQPGWRLPGVSEPLAALVEKEVRYFLRDGPTVFYLLMPVLWAVVMIPTLRRPSSPSHFFDRSPEMIFPFLAAYSFAILPALAHNSFGLDGAGMQILWLSPVRFRDVLLAKNIVRCLAMACTLAVMWLLQAMFLRPAGLFSVLTTLLALLFAVPVELAGANLLSLWYPKRLEFGNWWGMRLRGAAILPGMVLALGVLGAAAAIFRLAYRLGRPWIATLLFAALSGAAVWLYTTVLERTSELADRRREGLLEELSRRRGRATLLGV